MSETFDLAFHWDPMCPFAWLTSLWMDQVVDQRGLNVDWRFISLRILNADVDYETEFPPEYIEGHGAGLRLLRVAAAVRDAEGPAPMRPLYDALSDDRWDALVEADTEQALAATGRDVGTPIIRYRPPDGPAFFGPVISRVPDDDEAGPLWDAVLYLAGFPGFAELKRSLRERPQLPVYAPAPEEPGDGDGRTG